eukprot:g8169.t1
MGENAFVPVSLVAWALTGGDFAAGFTPTTTTDLDEVAGHLRGLEGKRVTEWATKFDAYLFFADFHEVGDKALKSSADNNKRETQEFSERKTGAAAAFVVGIMEDGRGFVFTNHVSKLALNEDCWDQDVRLEGEDPSDHLQTAAPTTPTLGTPQTACREPSLKLLNPRLHPGRVANLMTHLSNRFYEDTVGSLTMTASAAKASFLDVGSSKLVLEYVFGKGVLPSVRAVYKIPTTAAGPIMVPRSVDG